MYSSPCKVWGQNGRLFVQYHEMADSTSMQVFLTHLQCSYFIPSDTSTCIASGDPHYTTFDKLRYNFMGNCSYVMSKPCNDTIMPHFEVHADNENRYNKPSISYVKAVHVYVHMLKISILKGGTVQVGNEAGSAWEQQQHLSSHGSISKVDAV